MPKNAYVVAGRLTSSRTIALDEDLPMSTGEARVVVEAANPASVHGYRGLSDTFKEMRERQRGRGHIPPTREEVDNTISEERASWGDEV